jgi:hypothetical protein
VLSAWYFPGLPENRNIPQSTATHRCVAVCCSVLRYIAVYSDVFAVWVILRYVAVCCGMLRFSGRPVFSCSFGCKVYCLTLLFVYNSQFAQQKQHFVRLRKHSPSHRETLTSLWLTVNWGLLKCPTYRKLHQNNDDLLALLIYCSDATRLLHICNKTKLCQNIRWAFCELRI